MTGPGLPLATRSVTEVMKTIHYWYLSIKCNNLTTSFLRVFTQNDLPGSVLRLGRWGAKWCRSKQYSWRAGSHFQQPFRFTFVHLYISGWELCSHWHSWTQQWYVFLRLKKLLSLTMFFTQKWCVFLQLKKSLTIFFTCREVEWLSLPLCWPVQDWKHPKVFT